MARLVRVDLSDHFEAWREKTNLISSYVGDLLDLDSAITADSDIVDAINFTYQKVQDGTPRPENLSLINSAGTTLKTIYLYDSDGGEPGVDYS
tara:strand:- start:411 stop:689 length:279 start_codon:yes stop_codon:yes gene_type:complete